jgi:hypothetical protein
VDELTTVLPDFKRLQKLGVVSPSPAAWKMGFFKAVGGLRELRQVRLAYATFPEGALKFIGDLPNLEVLDLMQARQLSLKNLEQLQRCPKLVELNLSGADLDDLALPVLLGFPALKSLEVSNGKLSEASKAALAAKGITLQKLGERQAGQDSAWRPWME